MAANNMEIRFLGDANPLEKAAKEAQSSLDQVSRAAVGTGKALDQLPKIQKEVAQQAGNMAKQAAAAGGSLTKVAAQARSGGQALTNFGRVMQDLPFGPGGIANNLEAVALSMKALREESKATGQSIGSILLQSLKGGGGLITAVSLVSAGLSFASVGLSAWSRLFPDANEQVKNHAQVLAEARKALQEYVEGLDTVSRARVVGIQSAQEELIRLRTLYDATQNANIPLAERKKLVDQLQEQYPKYFKNIKDEIILAGGAKIAYDNLTQAIIASSRARAAQKILDELSGQLIALDQQQIDAGKEITKKYEDLARVQEEVRRNEKGRQLAQTGSSIGTLINLQNVVDAENKYADAVRKSSDIQEKRRDILAQQLNLTKELNQVVEKNPEALLNPTGSVKEVRVKTDKLKIRPGVIEIEDLKDFRASLPDPDNQKLPVRPSITWEPTEQQKQLERLKAEFGEFSKQVNTLLEQSLEGLSINLGEGLADAITGKGLADAFRSIANLMGSFIEDLGKLLIKNAIQVEVFQKALATLMANPVAALAAGIALVAIGKTIRNSVPSTPHLQHGGLATGATLAMVGEGPRTSASNPEVIAPLDKLKDLIGAGSGFPQYLPAIEFTYDQVRLMYKLANDKGQIFR